MDTSELQERLIKHGDKKPGAEVYFRESWQCYYFSLLGKCFGMMNEELITLKHPAEKNEQLRVDFKDIIPGYYANKAHWNSICLNTEEISEKQIKEFIDISYQLVFNKLPKKEQKKLN